MNKNNNEIKYIGIIDVRNSNISCLWNNYIFISNKATE